MIRAAAVLVCALALAGCGTGSSSEEAFAQASAESAAAAASEAVASSPPPTPTEAPSPTADPESSSAAPSETATPSGEPTESPSRELSGRFTGGFVKPERLARILEFSAEGGSGGTKVTGITNNFVELVDVSPGIEFSATIFATVEDSCGTIVVAQTMRFVDDTRRAIRRETTPMQLRVVEADTGCELVSRIYDGASDVTVEVFWQALDADRFTGIVNVVGVPGLVGSEFRLTRAE